MASVFTSSIVRPRRSWAYIDVRQQTTNVRTNKAEYCFWCIVCPIFPQLCPAMKKGRTKPVRPQSENEPRLENEFRSQLNRARSSGADGRVGCSHVGRSASATKR